MQWINAIVYQFEIINIWKGHKYQICIESPFWLGRATYDLKGESCLYGVEFYENVAK